MSFYVDVAIGAILLLAVIVGIIKGFVKQFTRGLCGFIGLIGSIGLTLLIMPELQKAGMLKGFATTAAGWFTGEEFTVLISSEEDLLAALSSGFLKILSNLSSRIWANMQAYGMATLGEYFGDMCARLITGVLLWIVLLLAIKFIFLGIRKLFEKLATLPVLKTLNRIFGAVWSVAITYVIVVCIITTAAEIVMIKFIPSMQPTLEQLVNETAIFQVLHETNIIGSYIARMFGVDLAALAPIG